MTLARRSLIAAPDAAAAALFLWVWLRPPAWNHGLLGATCLGPDATGREREMAFWILSNVIFFAGIFAVMFVPVPILGVTADGNLYGLHGRYEWANHPYEAAAAGFLYFSLMALIRFIDPRIGAELSDAPAPRPPGAGAGSPTGTGG